MKQLNVCINEICHENVMSLFKTVNIIGNEFQGHIEGCAAGGFPAPDI